MRYPTHKKEIRLILESEQQFFCAYTEERISAISSIDVEHFNPTFKNTINDGYENWFAVSHKWNQIKKDEQWANLQPILHPTAKDIEERLFYKDGYYVNSPEDVLTENLKRFLDLNNMTLVTERKKYIQRLKFLETKLNLEEYLDKYPNDVYYRRAIKSEFDISL